MKRIRDLLNKRNRSYFLEAVVRRKSYYLSKFRGLPKRNEMIEAYVRSSKCKRLHLGSGPNILEGWLNSDILHITNGMIFVDVRDRLPMDDATFDFVYSEHLLEHLSYDEGFSLLKECFRILKLGGMLRVSTPDLNFLMELYTNESDENGEYVKWASGFYWHLSTCSKALVVNNYLRSWGHKFIYDFELLKETCERAGFDHVTRQSVGKSRYVELTGVERHGDIISNKWNIKESLVIEAEKRLK